MIKTFFKYAIYASLYALCGVLLWSAFLPHHPSAGWAAVKNIAFFISLVFLLKYVLYLVITPWYDANWTAWKMSHKAKIARYNPRVSVLIPAWNEDVGLISTVESVLQSTYDNVEVIVINDGSKDTSDASMLAFEKHFEAINTSSKSLVYQYQKNGGKGSALNTGIELSTGELILTIDADCVVQPEAIGNFVTRFADPSVMAAVGNVKVGNHGSLISMIQYLEFIFTFYFKRADSMLGGIYIIGGAAGAFRKEVFEKLGPYNEKNITEDIELTVRIQAAGMKIVYAADSIVYTEGASDIRGLAKQRLRWKKGRMDTFVKYRKLFFSMNPKHNKFLTWFLLPLAIFGDTELLVEIPFILFLYALAAATQDYSTFISLLVIVVFVFVMQVFASDRKYSGMALYVLAPIAWLLFYVITLIEINALLHSFWLYSQGREVKWQSWKRTGVKETPLTQV